jgi:hypothetical protein
MTPKPLLNSIAVLLLLPNLTACKSVNDGAKGSKPSAFVTQADATRAYEIIKAIDYVPFDYPKEGCFARAYFMAMELAVQGIPSSSQYVARTKGRLMFGEIEWKWHVAPALMIVDDPSKGQQRDVYRYQEVTKADLDKVTEEVTIVDPSMSPEPISVKKWFGLMLEDDTRTYALMAPGNWYDASVPPLLGGEPQPDIVKNFDEMGTFKLSHVARACGVLNRFLFEDEARKKKLSERAAVLVAKLEKLGKLERDVESMDPACPFIKW